MDKPFTPVPEFNRRMFANGLELPNPEFLSSMIDELQQHGTTAERVIAIKLGELRGVPNADSY